jgi:hypothetical protein
MGLTLTFFLFTKGVRRLFYRIFEKKIKKICRLKKKLYLCTAIEHKVP